MSYHRELEEKIADQVAEPRHFIQVLLGPRQVGKTTIAKDIFDKFKGPKVFISADDPGLSESQNLAEYWNLLREKILAQKKDGLLIIDEIHKYHQWEKTVKAYWDEDSRKKTKLKVIILGSAPLLIQKGLSESLAGRFEVTEVPHWMYEEAHQAFKVNIDEYIYFGGYPGSLNLINDENRWKSYIKNSLIETTISRDIMLLTRIDKPALLRQLFFLSCEYSGQILSYQKMVGQLQDAGNTTTLAHYLELLSAVGFVKGLQKFTGSKVLTRASSPKLQVYNTALLSALSNESFETIKQSPEKWGRWVESAVGAHLLNKLMGTAYKLEYWKEGPYEVDFVLSLGKKVVAIEVKSGKKKESLPGLAEIRKKHNIHRALVLGPQGIPLSEFFKMDLEDFFKN
ncbi:MAG: ATP-binding protein [Bdellovibrio sp.]|nr:ATP-binding protein [Bdellovibrio sp.]